MSFDEQIFDPQVFAVGAGSVQAVQSGVDCWFGKSRPRYWWQDDEEEKLPERPKYWWE